MKIVSLRALYRDPPSEPAVVTRNGVVIGTWTPEGWENELARQRILAELRQMGAQIQTEEPGPGGVVVFKLRQPSLLERMRTRFGR